MVAPVFPISDPRKGRRAQSYQICPAVWPNLLHHGVKNRTKNEFLTKTPGKDLMANYFENPCTRHIGGRPPFIS